LRCFSFPQNSTDGQASPPPFPLLTTDIKAGAFFFFPGCGIGWLSAYLLHCGEVSPLLVAYFLPTTPASVFPVIVTSGTSLSSCDRLYERSPPFVYVSGPEIPAPPKLILPSRVTSFLPSRDCDWDLSPRSFVLPPCDRRFLPYVVVVERVFLFPFCRADFFSQPSHASPSRCRCEPFPVRILLVLLLMPSLPPTA